MKTTYMLLFLAPLITPAAADCATVEDVKYKINVALQTTATKVRYAQSAGLRGGYLVSVGSNRVAIFWQFDKHGCLAKGGTGPIDAEGAALRYFDMPLLELFPNG